MDTGRSAIEPEEYFEGEIEPTASGMLDERQAEQTLSRHFNLEALFARFPVIARHLAYADSFKIIPSGTHSVTFISENYDRQTGALVNRAVFTIDQDAQGNFNVKLEREADNTLEPTPTAPVIPIRRSVHRTLATPGKLAA